MKFKLQDDNEHVQVRLVLARNDVNMEAYVDGSWKLLAWVEPDGHVLVSSTNTLPTGFTSDE